MKLAAWAATAVTLLGAGAGVTSMGCEGREAPPPPAEQPAERVGRSERHVAMVDLRQGAPETVGGGLFGGPPDRTFARLVVRLRELTREEEVAGVFVKLGAASLPLAQSQEVGALLGALRDRSLPVVCHADGYDNSSMLLAAGGCSEIWLSAAGTVDTVGLAAQLMFGRSLLERLHVDVDFLQIGDFKGASEPFTRDSASPESRASLKKALSGLRAGWLSGLSGGRPGDPEALGVEAGPHTPDEALARKLVDRVGFEHQAQARALELAGTDGYSDYFGGKPQQRSGVGELVRVLASGGQSRGPHVAVVVASGSISLQGGGGLGGGGITARELGKTLQRVRDDPDARAVVLRLDSPGGSALASDLLWSDLMRLREEKPLIVSVGGMAASGGYYMACAGHRVVAEPTSIIGSIGVVTGKLSFSRSLQEVGIHVETVPAAPGDKAGRALYASPFAPWDDGTRARMRATAEHIYDLFLKRIGEARDMQRGAIEPYAAGRIMGGQHAKEAGLIDDLGGLSDAVRLAIERAELEPDIDVRIVQPLPPLLALLGADPDAAEAAMRRRLAEQAEWQAALRGALGNGSALQPALPGVERFVSSISPLLRGEPTVAALPYAVWIE